MPLDGPSTSPKMTCVLSDLPTPESTTHKPTAFKPQALTVRCTASPRLFIVYNQPDVLR